MFAISTATLVLVMSTATVDNNVLTIEHAVTSACENRAELIQAELSISSAEAGLLKSTLWFIPALSATAAVNAMEAEVPEIESYSSSVGFNASMSLFNLQSIGSRRVSAVSADIAREAARTTRATVIFDAASSWYSMLQSQESLVLAELNLSTQEEAFRVVASKYDTGMISRYEFLAGHVSLENTRPAFTAAQAEFENSLGDVSLATGIENCCDMTMEGNLSDALPVTIPSSSGQLADLAVLESSETLMARLSLESAEAATFTAWGGYAPSVNLNGSVSWGNSADGFSELGDNDLTRTSTVGVSVSLPIFNSLASETAVRTARYSELSAEYELARVEKEVRQSSLEAWNNHRSASQRLIGASALVLEAQEALDIARITYQAGSITRLDLEQSILGLISARNSSSQAQLAMRMAELNIAMLTGEIHEIWEVE
ncbi:hypothetical protein DRQ21_11660 [Candidatus Fermentibacteria bacterium]|nr:MAG: hypothetical protein DRQ21_11660 [Candidatus Fermentibacteria bacterium]